MERCFKEKIDREMGYVVETVQNRIQNAILSAYDSIIALQVEITIRSIFTSSGRDATSVKHVRNVRNTQGLLPLLKL